MKRTRHTPEQVIRSATLQKWWANRKWLCSLRNSRVSSRSRPMIFETAMEVLS